MLAQEDGYFKINKMAVGDRQGQVYISKEGYGEAAILPNINTFNQASAVAQGLFPKKKPPLNKEAIMKDIREGKPDYWINHSNELTKEFDNLLNYAADITASGVDPTKSGDKASADFQKRWAKLEADGMLSQQLRKNFEKGQAIINDPKKPVTEKSIREWNDYFNKPFSEHRAKGGLPPRLVPQDALYKYSEGVRGIAKGIDATNKDYKPEDVRQATKMAFDDETHRQGIEDALTPRLEELVKGKDGNADPIKMKLIEAEATRKGYRSPLEMLYNDDVTAHLGKEPLDLMAAIKGATPAVSMKGSSYEDKENVTRGSETVWLDPNKAQGAAELLLDTDPRWLEEVISKGLATDRKTAVKFISETMKNFAKESHKTFTKRDTDRNYRGTGYGRKEVEEDKKVYDEFLRGTINELPGIGPLKPWMKQLGRNLTAAYAEGAKYKDGVLILKGKTPEGKDARTGGKGRSIYLSEKDNAALSASMGSTDNMGEYPIVYAIQQSVSGLDEETGERISKKELVPQAAEFKSVTKSDKPDVFLNESTTQGWHAHGMGQKKEKFTDVVVRAIQNEEKRRQREAEAGFLQMEEEKASTSNNKGKSSTKKKGGKYNF
jgi:hypothetical protein